MSGFRTFELRMSQKHAGREGTSEEERKEKEEKGSTARANVCNLWHIYLCNRIYHSTSTFLFYLIFFTFSEEEEEEESEEEGEDPALDSLSQAIAFQVRVQRQEIST